MRLISIDDLEPGEIGEVIRGRTAGEPTGGRLVALLDFLPLGAEELALRAAAARLGATLVTGREIFPGFPEGVDLLLAARAAGSYADAVVIRHPLKGAARAAAAVARAPVLNGGDGSGEDPLFALADLAVLSERLGGLSGKSVALCGDLRNNRRAHSLIGGLFASGARVVLVPAKGAEPREGLLDQLASRDGYHPVRFGAQTMSSLLDMVDSWLLTPDLDHQLSLFSDIVASSDRERKLVGHQVREVHAIWVASARDGCGEPRDEEEPSPLAWRSGDGRLCISPSRPGEGESEWEGRSAVETGALAAALALALTSPDRRPLLPPDAYVGAEGIGCEDPRCVVCREKDRVMPAFLLLRTDPVLLSCLYCMSRRKVTCMGSRIERRYHRVSSVQAKRILPRNTVFFAGPEEAEAAGFVASRI